ncbi:hypothetical protein ACHAO8_001389 [Botrytis cinerea]
MTLGSVRTIIESIGTCTGTPPPVSFLSTSFGPGYLKNKRKKQEDAEEDEEEETRARSSRKIKRK